MSRYVLFALLFVASNGFAVSAAEQERVVVYKLDLNIMDLFLMYDVNRPEAEDRIESILDEETSESVTTFADALVVELPKLKDEEQQVFAQHLALFERMSQSIRNTLDPDDKDIPYDAHRERFDFGMGSGLSFLSENYGIDSIVFYEAMQAIPDSSRTMQAHDLHSNNLTYLYAGMVDTSSGRITWFDSVSGDNDLRLAPERKALVAALFERYPESRFYKEVAR